MVKNTNTPAMQETRFRSLGLKDPLEKGMATHARILFGEFHGQRSLVDYSPMGHKELDMTEWLIHTHTHTNIHTYKHICIDIHIHMDVPNHWEGKCVSFCAVPCQGICMWLLLMGKSFSSDEASTGTPPPRTKQSPFLGTLLTFPKQTFFHAGSCESLLWAHLCPFLDLCLEFPSVLEHGGCSADMSTYAWMFLSKWTLICSVRTNLCSLLVSIWDGVLINTSWFLEGEG